MTRIGVLSDSHRMPEPGLRAAADALRARGVDRAVHLGDGMEDWAPLERMLGVPMTLVAGNCDGASNAAREAVIRADGARILLCHGDRLGVKYGLLRLKLRAEALGCSVALYGHTHAQAAAWADGILLLNPGALRDGRFAVLTVDGGAVSYALLP